MNDSIRTGMAEASRLTRAGQLIEATALIQRTLRGMLAPEASSDTTDRTTDEPVDITFRVIDVAPLPTEVSAQGSDHQTRTSAVATLPLPDVVVPPHERGSASAELTDTRADPHEDQHSGAPSTLQQMGGSERGEFIPATPRWPARLRATLRLPRRGLGGPVSIPMSERARSDIWAGGQFIDGSYTNPDIS
jgi:hypothetical protein